ncbi:hypothetical protein CVT24_004853 [Panaeolus cyanescens]|uniref:F-box domain-containing protein n=1 Tax=Panaeolus cyanescens TaxID=181874 RepID=A0A409WYI6_9AGAR|nr:hypothetical protein CVT24_004853 [Panaeolus cyanescens]
MFNTVHIYMYKDLNRTQKLAAAINNNPTLATYIRELDFYDRGQRDRCQPIGADQDGSLDPFLNLPNLQHLKVNGRGGKTYGVAPSGMEASLFSFQRVLDQYMTSSTLTTLSLHSISRLPILDIMRCPNLENLTLNSHDLKSWNNPAPSDVLTRGFKLKTILNTSTHDVTISLLAYCPNLESIHFAKMGGPPEPRQERFPINATPLKTFNNVTFIESWGPVDWPYFCRLASWAGVKAFPALRRLRLRLFHAVDITPTLHLFEHINPLEELHVEGKSYLDPTPLSLQVKQCFALSANTLKTVSIHEVLDFAELKGELSRASLPPPTMSEVDLATSMSTNDPEGPVFPFEIFEIIIRIIASPIARHTNRRFSNSDIASLSLVSKSFAEICQPLLFKCIQIFGFLDMTAMSSTLNFGQLKQLVDAIKTNPTLASYICCLQYYEPHILVDGPISFVKDGSLIPLLHLPSLQHLKVDGYIDRSYEHPYTGMELFSFRSLLDQYLVSSTLTSLVIRRISELPILDILSCPNLEFLRLLDCDVRSWDHPAPSKVIAKGFKLKVVDTYTTRLRNAALPLLAYCPQLERLQFAAFGDFPLEMPEAFPIDTPPLTSFKNVTFIKSRGAVDWSYFCRLADSASVKAFPALKHLHVEVFTLEEITHGPNLIFGHMQSLEELRVEVRDYLDPTSLNLEQCFSVSAQTIKSITIKWRLILDSGHYQSLLETLRISLQEMSHNNVLRRLNLEWELTNIRDQTVLMDFEQWNDLDYILTADNGAAFPRLVDVRISLEFNMRNGAVDEEQDLESLFELSMNRLLNSQDICTSFQVSGY